MRFQNTSNMHSSQLNSSERSAREVGLRELVAERAGRDWCLFLDRDGVINRRVVGDYVRNLRHFEWLPGVPLALKKLGQWAPHMVVVTNQQGIDKGLMSAADVEAIHDAIQTELAVHGVSFDAFQVCPHLRAAECSCRKPRPGLVLEWLVHHPHNDPKLSIIAGDSRSDLEMARNVAGAVGGCMSAQIGRTSMAGLADASFDSLWDFAVAVEQVREEQGL